MADDLSFTFDTSLFQRGINRITKGMDSMQTTATTVARGISKGFNVVIGKLAVLKGAFVSIKSTLNQMPEVGKAFGIAKNVFLKNLLFPLRKELLPLLQKMMDWVRDNRTLFVKWGQTIAGVFRAAVSGFKTLLSFAKKITKTLFSFINDMFGTTINSFEDLLNIVAFKIATVIEFLKILVGPIMNILAPVAEFFKDVLAVVLEKIVPLFEKIATFAVEIAASFSGGFLKGVKGIEGPIGRIFDAISGIVDKLFTGEGPLKFWKDVFEVLGFVVGTTLKLAFQAIAVVLETIEIVIQKIKDFFTSPEFEKFIENTAKFFKAIGAKIRPEDVEGAPAGFERTFGDLKPPPVGELFERIKNLTIDNFITINGLTEENAEVITTRMLEGLRVQYEEEFTRGGR